MARVGEKQRWPQFGAPGAVRLVPLIVVGALLLYVRAGAVGLGIGLGVALLLLGVIAWSLRRQSPTSSGALFSQQGGLRVADLRGVPSVFDQASVEPSWADVRLKRLKGVGEGVGADFLLRDGRPLGVWTAKPEALAEALRTVGVAVQVST